MIRQNRLTINSYYHYLYNTHPVNVQILHCLSCIYFSNMVVKYTLCWLYFQYRCTSSRLLIDRWVSKIIPTLNSWVHAGVVKPGFHMIARIDSDARIAQRCHQRSLRRNGNPLFKAAAILFKAAAIIARNAGHKTVRPLRRWRSYGNQA